MRQCPSCGFRNTDSRETCLKCKASLVERFDLVDKPTTSKMSPLNGLTNTYYRLRRFTFRWGRRIWRKLTPEIPRDIPHRFPFVAAFLALLPGLGQIYNHQPLKAFYFFTLFAATLTIAIINLTVPYMGTAMLFTVGFVMMFSYSDALITAAKINGQYFTLRNRLAALTYPMFMVGMIFFLSSILAWANWPIYKMSVVGGDYMAPELAKGDRIMHEGISYFFRDPKPGDVVRYDPPRYVIVKIGQIGNDEYVMNPMNGWERIMAVGGETLTAINGRYYVDGRELSESYHPLAENQMYKNFTIECPPDHYIILITRQATTKNIINALQGATAAPDIHQPGIIVKGWNEACIVSREDIFTRAWFIYYPGPRRQFFKSEGPRFVDSKD